MQPALAGTALLMGLAAGPHCVAMCGAASAGVIRMLSAPAGGPAPGSQPPVARLVFHPSPRATTPGATTSGATTAAALRSPAAGALFHLGRLAGYAMAGAIAAGTVQGLALAGEQVAALRPAWVLLHVAVLAWGLLLAATGRQPLWAHRLGQRAMLRLRAHRGGAGGLLAAGAAWVAMPCGLLYSAVLLASLGNGPLGGAAAMALFALGSALPLMAAPWLWQRLRGGFGPLSQRWGARLAGLLLALLSLQALGLDLRRQIELWCA